MKFSFKSNNQLQYRIRADARATVNLILIHGLGESGYCFDEAWNLIKNKVNILIPDLPGFGESAETPYPDSFDSLAKLVADLSLKELPRQKTIIVGHSLGGLIGCHLSNHIIAQNWPALYVNVEGTITLADTFFTGLTQKADNPIEYKGLIIKECIKLIENNISIQRYFTSLIRANADALFSAGKLGYTEATQNLCLRKFEDLNCEKFFFYGSNSMSPESITKLKTNKNIKLIEFSNCGHWPMIEQPNQFYKKLEDIALA